MQWPFYGVVEGRVNYDNDIYWSLSLSARMCQNQIRILKRWINTSVVVISIGRNTVTVYCSVLYLYTLQLKFSQYFVSSNLCNAHYKSGVFPIIPKHKIVPRQTHPSVKNISSWVS